MASTYLLYPAAEADLEIIWNYSANAWGIEQANSYIDNFNAFQLLAENPNLCRLRLELTVPVYHYHYHYQHHAIVYQKLGKDIHIIRILHESMDYETQLDR
jgi:toxin ParE1/3/4